MYIHSKDSFLFRSGDPSTKCYIIWTGRVILVVADRHVSSFGSGQVEHTDTDTAHSTQHTGSDTDTQEDTYVVEIETADRYT